VARASTPSPTRAGTRHVGVDPLDRPVRPVVDDGGGRRVRRLGRPTGKHLRSGLFFLMSNTRQVAETAGQSAMTTDGYGFASSAIVWTDVRDAGGVPRYAQANARSWKSCCSSSVRAGSTAVALSWPSHVV